MALDALSASDGDGDGVTATDTNEETHELEAPASDAHADSRVSSDREVSDEEETIRDGTESDAEKLLAKTDDAESRKEVAGGGDEKMENVVESTLDAAAASMGSDAVALKCNEDAVSMEDNWSREGLVAEAAEQSEENVEDVGGGIGNGDDTEMQLPEVADTEVTSGTNDDVEVVVQHIESVESDPVCASVASSTPVDTVLPVETSTLSSKTISDKQRVENDELVDPTLGGSTATMLTRDLLLFDSASQSANNESTIAPLEPSPPSKEVSSVVCEKQHAEHDDLVDATGENGVSTLPTHDEPACGLASPPANNESTIALIEPSLPSSKEMSDISSEEQHADNKDLRDDTKGDRVCSPPKLTGNECDPLAPPAVASCVPHGEDEYDPANPSSAGTPVESNILTSFNEHRPATEQEEYDPEYPFMTPAAPDKSVAMELSPVTPAKRKADDEANPPSDVPETESADSKRLRCNQDGKSLHESDHKEGRHRRGSGDSTLSTSSKQKNSVDDHKGLSAAAWDRLMDFQTSGEFRVTQVSRAAFASVGAMPEFAQIAIIARFVRTPMRDIRDKNGQLMRIYREYQKENPQVAVLQPVDAFISDYKSDSGLFRFGYAPPQPVKGISTVQVPYQRDQVPEDLPVKHSSRQARNKATRSDSDKHLHKNVDEFGRAVNKELAHEPNASTHPGTQRSLVDSSFSTNRQAPSVQAVPPAATRGRAEDSRSREQPRHQNSSGAGRDPRRHGSLSSQQMSPCGNLSHAAGSSDLYERLSVPVKAVVNSMRREGRLQEPLNDNVITRLLHLPERVALQAVENFSNVDLSQVTNLQGFLVGIINRVNEKAIASEKLHRPHVPSPRGHSASAISIGGRNHGPPAQGVSVLGGPPQGGRLNSTNGMNYDGYRGQLTPKASDPASSLYERPFDAPQDTRDPRRRQPAPQVAPQYGGAVRGEPSVGTGHGPIGMHSFTVLPVSVQNHVHALVADQTLTSLEELGGKCYEVLGQLSEPLANQVLTRFAGANLSNVRNKSGFLIGVVKRARQEYGFN
uniref:Heterogeneous nuclear ribonucleoprotein Q acidic domain-containing protein n=1 Tax=Hyaloperonospora arabidopsidis (strain Emoy2) TaxID=559515 RepID=M4BDK0_HYAAE